MIKILHLLPNAGVGGLELMVRDFSAKLDLSRFNPIICSLRQDCGAGEFFAEANLRFIEYPCDKTVSLKGWIGLSRILRNEKIDIIHTHGKRPAVFGRMAGLFAKTKVLYVHIHDINPPSTFLQKWLDRRLYKYTKRYLGCSKAVIDVWRERIKLPEEKFQVFYNFIQIDKYKSKLTKAQAKQKLGIESSSPVIGFVRRMTQSKDPMFFLDAFQYFLNKYPHAKAVVVGDGELFSSVSERVESTLLKNHVILTGSVTKGIEDLYAAMDLMAMTSIGEEGLPRVILEAQAADVIPVARWMAGVYEAIGNGGVLVKADAPDSVFAEAMAEALTKHEYYSHLMRENLKRFDCVESIKNLEKMYEFDCNSV